MNTTCCFARRAARVGVCSVFALGGTAFATNPEAAKVEPTDPKTYVLFMGADIALEQGKTIHPVADVTSTSLVIKPGGKTVKVSLESKVNLHINESLKIARTSLGVDGLKAERAYSAWTDPFANFARNYSIAAGETAVADLANGKAVMANFDVLAASMNPDPTAMAQAVAAHDKSEAELVQAYNTPISSALGTGTLVNKMGLEEGDFDAIRLSFDVISDKDLAQPYYAFIAQIRDRDSKPGEVRKWAFVKSLGTINAGVIRKVNVYRSGLPPGYILESYEVHLYNGAEELATNLSRKRVPITAEEAIEFRIIEYVGANKGRTLAATPMVQMLASEVSATLTSIQLSETCYVRVGKNGRVISAFHDAEGKQPLSDPVVESALKRIQFKPALTDGKPIESVVPFKLGRFVSS